jgi:hypothetical protein
MKVISVIRAMCVALTPAAVSDFRAVYGGLHYAIALTLWASSRATRLFRHGLFLALLTVGGLAFGRMS